MCYAQKEKKPSKKKSKKRKRSEESKPEKASKPSSNFMRGFVLTNNDKKAPLCILDRKHSSAVNFPGKDRFKALRDKSGAYSSVESDEVTRSKKTIDKKFHKVIGSFNKVWNFFHCNVTKL